MTSRLPPPAAAAAAAAAINAALAAAHTDKAKAQSMLFAAIDGLGNRPGKKALRPFMIALLELGTADALDRFFTIAAKADLPPALHELSRRAWRTLLGGFVAKMPTMSERAIEDVVYNVVAVRVSTARADDELRGLLCALVDDVRLTRPRRNWAAQELLSEARPATAEMRRSFVEAVAARQHDDALGPELRAAALLRGDSAQAFEELVDRYRNDEGWRREIAFLVDERSDARFIDEAIRVVAADPISATRTLSGIKSKRAIDELLQWADTAGAFDRIVQNAIAALGVAREPRATPVILRWLEPVGSPGTELEFAL